MRKRIARILTTPVRTFNLAERCDVMLTKEGVVENRRFFLTRPDGQRLRSSRTFWSNSIEASYDQGAEELIVRLQDGTALSGSALGNGRSMRFDIYGNEIKASLLSGPWDEPLSDIAGHEVRIARPHRPGSAFTHPVTLLSTRSVDRLNEAMQEQIGSKRFKLLFEVAGCETPHEEDSWRGRKVGVGEAVILIGGPVPRCAMVTHDPDTGEKDVDVLAAIHSYRGRSENGTVDFGVYGEVVEPGKVAVGDEVKPL